jgi:outer membrane protein assembly factor BamB
VYALNSCTGAKLWHYTTGDVANFSPAVVDGVVHVGSEDSSIYAFNLK